MDIAAPFLILGLVGFVAALMCPPIRKTLGLLSVILGGIFCLTVIGAIVGIPMILVGGLFLFMGK